MLFGRRGYGNRNMCCNQPMMENPVMEPVVNKCIEREFYHEVPQE